MAVNVTTGTMGAGKTAYVVDQICYNPLYKDRKVYHNINGLDRENSEYWTKEQFQNWFVEYKEKYGTEREEELELNVIFVIDETQFVFPNRVSTSKPPEYIAMLDVHRHYGVDFFLITQDLKKCDPVLRGESVHEHIHIWDSGVLSKFGITNKSVFKGARANPSSSIRTAVSTNWYRIPKRTRKHYKSAALHTKTSTSMHSSMYIIMAGFLVAGYFGYKAFTKPERVPQQAAKAAESSQGGVTYANDTNALQDAAKPFSVADIQPVDTSYPQSMPIYDGARPLKPMRRIAGCVKSKKACNCYDAEGVKITYVPLDTCTDFLAQEYYSPYAMDVQAGGGSNDVQGVNPAIQAPVSTGAGASKNSNDPGIPPAIKIKIEGADSKPVAAANDAGAAPQMTLVN